MRLTSLSLIHFARTMLIGQGGKGLTTLSRRTFVLTKYVGSYTLLGKLLLVT